MKNMKFPKEIKPRIRPDGYKVWDLKPWGPNISLCECIIIQHQLGIKNLFMRTAYDEFRVHRGN